MSIFVLFLFITFDLYRQNVVIGPHVENPNETCTVKEFGALEERLTYSLTMTSILQEGDFPLKVKPPYDLKNCYLISRVVVKVYNPTNKPKIGLKYLSRPVMYAYIQYGLWQNFISHVEVQAFSFPTLSCGEDVIDESDWGRRNKTQPFADKPKGKKNTDDTK